MGFIDPSQLDPVSDEGGIAAPTSGRFITSTDLDPEVPSLFENPIDALTSADWWLTRPDGERISAQQAVTGAPLSLLNSLTGNAGDEIVAGGNAALDSVFGGPGYDARLAETRNIQENTPLATQIIMGLAGASKLPIPTSVNVADPLKVSALKLALEGSGYGAAYGFGAGEGGFNERLGSAGESAAWGGALSPALGVPALAAAKWLGYIGSKAPEWAAGQDRKSLQARQGDYAKTANDLGVVDLPEGELGTLTRKSLDDVISSGLLGESRDPAKMLPRIMDEETAIGRQISGMVEGYGSKVEPQFTAAEAFLRQGKVPADRVAAFRNRLENLKTGIEVEGANALPFIQQQKIALGTMWEPNDTVSNGFTRAIYDDLKRTIESAVPDVQGLNKELQKLKITKPIIQRGVAAEDAMDPQQKLIQFLRTSGGYGVPIGVGTWLGGPLGAAAGAALGAGTNYLGTPQGRKVVAETLRGAASSIPAKVKAIEAVVGKIPVVVGAERRRLETDPEAQSKPTGYRTLKSGPKEDSSNNSRPTPPATQAPSITPGKLDVSYSPDRVAKAEKGLSRAEVEKLGKSGTKEIQAQMELRVRQLMTKENKSLSEAKEIVYQEMSGASNAVMKDIFKAVVTQESGGRKDALGRVVNVGHGSEQATGLMQVLPSTAKDIAKELGYTKYDLKDPETNRIFGEYYLKKLITQFDGDLELALTAYHSGPGRVENLLKIHDASTFKEIRKHLGPVGQKYAPEIIARIKKNSKNLSV